ncbi:hypothetical protein CVT25_008454 [Psilocybe cyanescens]|uniref:Uncharacterized protein n=1 Tax=Psilocybe cyanescens TaxID=93625 RepID=A0A409WUW1_PSICY|nr:hypothetical protein CVT25_008454 [Psilocybe cyanescens]
MGPTSEGGQKEAVDVWDSDQLKVKVEVQIIDDSPPPDCSGGGGSTGTATTRWQSKMHELEHDAEEGRVISRHLSQIGMGIRNSVEKPSK